MSGGHREKTALFSKLLARRAASMKPGKLKNFLGSSAASQILPVVGGMALQSSDNPVLQTAGTALSFAPLLSGAFPGKASKPRLSQGFKVKARPAGQGGVKMPTPRKRSPSAPYGPKQKPMNMRTHRMSTPKGTPKF